MMGVSAKPEDVLREKQTTGKQKQPVLGFRYKLTCMTVCFSQVLVLCLLKWLKMHLTFFCRNMSEMEDSELYSSSKKNQSAFKHPCGQRLA